MSNNGGDAGKYGPKSAGADLERELATAAKLTRDPRVVAAVATLNLRIDADGWGVGYVEFQGPSYYPCDWGEPALIFAAEHCGDLIDLVACRLRDRAVAARIGITPALGLDWIDIAAARARRLLLYADPLGWAHNGFCGAVLIDWQRARSLLADVPDIACASQALAGRVHQALTVPVPRLSYARAA